MNECWMILETKPIIVIVIPKPPGYIEKKRVEPIHSEDVPLGSELGVFHVPLRCSWPGVGISPKLTGPSNSWETQRSWGFAIETHQNTIFEWSFQPCLAQSSHNQMVPLETAAAGTISERYSDVPAAAWTSVCGFSQNWGNSVVYGGCKYDVTIVI